MGWLTEPISRHSVLLQYISSFQPQHRTVPPVLPNASDSERRDHRTTGRQDRAASWIHSSGGVVTESCVDITQRLRGSNILSLETFGIHVVDDLGPINSKDVITNRAVSVLCIQNVDDPSTKGGSELPLRTQTHTHTHHLQDPNNHPTIQQAVSAW